MATCAARVAGVCAEAARALGFEPTLRFKGPVETLVPGAEADDILAVVREGLANVARHSGARVVTVDIVAKNGRVTVTVADDGRGLELGGRVAGHGLANLRRRAEDRGGTFAASNRPAGGAELRWSVPLQAGD